MVRLFNKEELIGEIRKIFKAGWVKSVKKTIDKRNDGQSVIHWNFCLALRKIICRCQMRGSGNSKDKGNIPGHY